MEVETSPPKAIDAAADPELVALLAAREQAGAEPLLWAADLRLRGRPLVRAEADGLEAFRRSRLDALYVGSRRYLGAMAEAPD